MHARLTAIWYQGHWAASLLLPLAVLYRGLVALRRWAYRHGLLPVKRLPVPVVVVGNIAVGGTGKTPLVIALAGYLRARGRRPGVISRGYGAVAGPRPALVRPESDPAEVGDEPVLIARRTGTPVAVDPDRLRGARVLVDDLGCDIIISDDGLQHYRLGRDVEIAVIDGVRRHGNGHCLPAGPLREPVNRLRRVDMVVTNGEARRGEFSMRLLAGPVTALNGAGPRRRLRDFADQEVHAVCGIGHPQRFFALLRSAGIRIREHAFVDHHSFVGEDLALAPRLPILMTEKDAVKCARLGLTDAWAVSVVAELPEVFYTRFDRLLGLGCGEGVPPAPAVP